MPIETIEFGRLDQAHDYGDALAGALATGKRIAVIQSLLATAKLNGLEPAA